MLHKVSLHTILLHKASLSILIAACLFFTLTIAVSAQTDSPDAGQAQLLDADPLVTSMVQSVPVTLTFSVPGADGPVTVEVPVILSFDIQVGIGSVVTTNVIATTVVVTDSVPTEVVTPTSSPTPVPTDTPTALPTATPTQIPATPTPIPTATETPVAEETEETAQEAPQPAPTIALPTPTPSAPVTETDTAPETEDAPVAETSPVTDTTGIGETAPPTQTITDTQTGEITQTVSVQSVVTSPNCPDPRAVIALPVDGETVAGIVEFAGTATHENFWYYKLEYLPISEETAEGEEAGEGTPTSELQFAFLADAQVQVADGQLSAIDTTELDNGLYTIRLTVVDNTGNFPPPCIVTISVQN